jgi:hypothetical protein
VADRVGHKFADHEFRPAGVLAQTPVAQRLARLLRGVLDLSRVAIELAGMT